MNGSNANGATQHVDNPPNKAGNANQEPGVTDNSKNSPDKNLDLGKLLEKVQSLEGKYEKSEAEKAELRREIGRLGDELGSARTQVQSTIDIKDIAEKFQSALLNPDDPETAFKTMVSLVNEAFMERDRSERETIQNYDKVTKRNPELSKLPYNEVRNKAMLDGVWHEIRSGNAMDRYMSNLLSSHNTPESIQKRIDEAEKRGAEAERKKLEASGMTFRSGGGNMPSGQSEEMTTADRIAMNMGYRKPS